jgi:cholest-4-en-3-one 26-monooxygenase
MIGADDPEYQVSPEASGQAAMELYAYADQLCEQKRLDPHTDLFSVLTQAELDGDSLSQLELDLFLLLLSVAGNETTRNLISGAMVAFFDNPDQWERLKADRTLLPSAVEEMLRFVTPVMHFRRQATSDIVIADQKIAEGDKVVFWHISANRDETVFADPDRFDIGRTANNHMAFGGGGPHFCLGANLARMEIRVMYDRLLDRLPDIHLDGDVQRLRSNFINGVKHIPVAFSPSAPVGA